MNSENIFYVKMVGTEIAFGFEQKFLNRFIIKLMEK